MARCWGNLLHSCKLQIYFLNTTPLLWASTLLLLLKHTFHQQPGWIIFSGDNQITALLWSEPSEGFTSLRIKPSVFTAAYKVLCHVALATLLSPFPNSPPATVAFWTQQASSHLQDFTFPIPSAQTALSRILYLPSSFLFFKLLLKKDFLYPPI